MKTILLFVTFISSVFGSKAFVPDEIFSFLKKEMTKEQAIESLRENHMFYNLVDFKVMDNNLKNPIVKWNIHFGPKNKTQNQKGNKDSTQRLNLTEILRNFKTGVYSEEYTILKLKEINFPYNVLSLKMINGKLRWDIGNSLNQNPKHSNLEQVLADYRKDNVTKDYVLAYLKKSTFIYNVQDINKGDHNQIEWNISLNKKQKREIASSSLVDIEPTEKKKKNSFSLAASFGKVEVTSEQETLDLTFIKLGLLYNRKLNKDYNLTTGINLTRFSEIAYSGGASIAHPSSSYFELSSKITKKINKHSIGLGYNLLNYFIITQNTSEVVLSQTFLNRLSASYSYSITEKLKLAANLGFLVNLENEINSGVDYGVSTIYTIDKDRKYSGALSLYGSQIDVTNGSTDKGKAVVGTFIYNF